MPGKNEASIGSRVEAIRAYNAMENPQAAADIAAEMKAREAMFSVPADLLQAPFVTLCSVWPERMHSHPFTHNGIGRKIYTIEGGSSLKPAYLLLQNAWDFVIQQEGIGERGFGQRTISAASIAHDLIVEWTGDHAGNKVGKMGIGIIHGERTNDPHSPIRATRHELQELEQSQTRWLKWIVERADWNWDHGKPEKACTPGNRRALDILGLDPIQHKWHRDNVQLYNKCPECSEMIPLEAAKCKHCDTDLARYFIEVDIAPDPDQWPGVIKKIALIKKKESKKQQ